MPDTHELLPEVQQFLHLRDTLPKKDRLPLPQRSHINPRFLSLANQIIDISGTWNPVEIYTVDHDNFLHQQSKLFESYINGVEYNPYFTYSHVDDIQLHQQHDDLMNLLIEVRNLETNNPLDGFVKKAFVYKIRDDLASCHLVESIADKNEASIKKLLNWKYPGTDPVLMRISQRIYEQLTIDKAFIRSEDTCIVPKAEYKRLQEWELTDEEQMSGFAYGLAKYGILKSKASDKGYNVIIDKRATSLDVRDKTPLGPSLFIPTYRATPMTAAKFLPLLAHEVEGHARQSMIGHELFILGGGPLKIDDEQLYEGYAIRMEEDCRYELFGIGKRLPRSYYPFAVRMAEQGASFYAIFSDQVQRRIRIAQKIPWDKPFPALATFSESTKEKAMQQSWRVTYRVMRGHIDMANRHGFAMAKDLGYLRGKLIDKQLQDHGYGYVNESAVIPLEGLPSFARFDFSEKDIPKSLQFKNVTKEYWEKVLKPQM